VTRPKNDIPPAPKLYPDGRGGTRWVTYWSDEQGKDRTKTFGSNAVPARKARQRYQHWLDTEWKVKAHVRTPRGEAGRFTIARLCGQYLLWARSTYRKRGKPTTHVTNIRYAMRALRDACGPELAADFSAPKLAALREAMIPGGRGGEAHAASTVNDRLSIIRAAFAWGREKGHVTREVANDLLHVRRVIAGRSKAKPAKKIQSVPRATVDAALGQLPPALVDMLNLLWLTGARPGEICDLCAADVETTGDVWLYVPPVHKLDHKNIVRVIPIGPKGQDIVRRYLTTNLRAPLFSPALAHGQRLEAKRAGRKTKLWPSHARRHKADPTADLSDRYTAGSLRKAVHRACDAAGVPRFNPNQVRHSAATITTKRFGKDAARALLGHTSEATTEIYLDPDVQTAMRVAKEVG
jgi:integrase